MIFTSHTKLGIILCPNYELIYKCLTYNFTSWFQKFLKFSFYNILPKRLFNGITTGLKETTSPVQFKHLCKYTQSITKYRGCMFTLNTKLYECALFRLKWNVHMCCGKRWAVAARQVLFHLGYYINTIYRIHKAM